MFHTVATGTLTLKCAVLFRANAQQHNAETAENNARHTIKNGSNRWAA